MTARIVSWYDRKPYPVPIRPRAADRPVAQDPRTVKGTLWEREADRTIPVPVSDRYRQGVNTAIRRDTEHLRASVSEIHNRAQAFGRMNRAASGIIRAGVQVR